jgi:hypothetical protein
MPLESAQEENAFRSDDKLRRMAMQVRALCCFHQAVASMHPFVVTFCSRVPSLQRN